MVLAGSSTVWRVIRFVQFAAHGWAALGSESGGSHSSPGTLTIPSPQNPAPPGVGVGPPGVGVGPPLQPTSAALTAWISSLIPTMESPLTSHAMHDDTGALPRAMFTQVMISLMATVPLPSQSPAHGACAFADVVDQLNAANARPAN